MPYFLGSSKFPTLGSEVRRTLAVLDYPWVCWQDSGLIFYIIWSLDPLEGPPRISHLTLRVCDSQNRSNGSIVTSIVRFSVSQGHSKMPFVECNRFSSQEPSLMVGVGWMLKCIFFLSLTGKSKFLSCIFLGPSLPPFLYSRYLLFFFNFTLLIFVFYAHYSFPLYYKIPISVFVYSGYYFYSFLFK